ncbi:MAG TPA: NAD(P)-dependent oxidoreductase [Stellaceae bacterium]|nr:NAD(P)-dependent oxidoreductase [Stellaceae bacterium]
MKVGFIGLGTQGKYLAINLAAAGHDLMVFDLRREPLEELAAAGAKVASSARAVGAHGEVIEICVLDDAQLDAVVTGADGVLAGAAKGAIVAVHSTVEPGTITRLAALAAEKGIELIDVPVSGSELGARAKTMSYMVGGSARAFEVCRPLFATSGPKITHTGGLGSGIRAKLAHQLIIAVNMLAAYEGMRLGVEAGLAPEMLQKVVSEGAAQSRVADRWFTMAMNPNAPKVFYKDLQLCLKFAHELGLSAPGAALAQQLLDRIVPQARDRETR